jgi:hypothetical protein
MVDYFLVLTRPFNFRSELCCRKEGGIGRAIIRLVRQRKKLGVTKIRRGYGF